MWPLTKWSWSTRDKYAADVSSLCLRVGVLCSKRPIHCTTLLPSSPRYIPLLCQSTSDTSIIVCAPDDQACIGHATWHLIGSTTILRATLAPSTGESRPTLPERIQRDMQMRRRTRHRSRTKPFGIIAFVVGIFDRGRDSEGGAAKGCRR